MTSMGASISNRINTSFVTFFSRPLRPIESSNSLSVLLYYSWISHISTLAKIGIDEMDTYCHQCNKHACASDGFWSRRHFSVFGSPLKGTFSHYFFWYLSYLIFVNRTSRTKLCIIINNLITESWLCKDGPKLHFWRHVKFWLFRPPSRVHFKSFLRDTSSTYYLS